MSSTPNKRRIVGTAGHIDHGKTALVRALTGTPGDRLPEEQRRGITIDLGFSFMREGDLQIGLIDVPGHERFVRNMLAGVGGIDSVLLVVAADESIKPQTREHFAICKLLGIQQGLVAITKSDLAEPEMIGLVRLEIEEMARGSFLEGKPILPVSSTTGEGMDDLRRAIIRSVIGLPDRESEKIYRMPIDRAFTMKGFGSVVTGTAVSGSLSEGSEIEIFPAALRSRARNIQVHGEPRERSIAGERTSINLADIPVGALRRGQQVAEPGSLEPTQILTAELRLLDEAAPLKDQSRVRLHHFSAELLASIRFLDGTGPLLAPGKTAFVQFRLESPVAAVRGDRYVIRRYSPATTVGGGVILDPHLGKMSRGTRPEILKTLASGSLGERVELLARLQGIRGITLADLQLRTGYRTPELAALLRGEPLTHLIETERAARWVHESALADFRIRAMEFLKTYIAENRMALGVPKSELIQKLMPARADPSLVNFLVQDLATQRIAVIAGDLIDIPGRSKQLGGAEGDLARLIEQRFADAALKPPPVSELIQTIQQKPKVIEGVVTYLVKTGTLVRLAEGVYLHRDAVGSATATLEPYRGKTMDVGAFKELFGLSRKIVIPLLEYFDRARVTRRVGDAREIL